MTRIRKLIGIDGCTLLIYYYGAEYWQFSVIGKQGKLWQPEDIFFCPHAAEREGRLWVKFLLPLS